MIRAGLCALALAFAVDAAATEAVTIPWQEFRDLYHQNVERAVRDELPSPPEKPVPLYTILVADYQLSVDEDRASGRVSLSGEVIAGTPKPIPLFGSDLVVSQVQSVEGGSLLGGEDGYRLYVTGEQPFRVVLDVAVPIIESEGSRLLSFRVPAAVQGAVTLQLAEGYQMLEPPGLESPDGRYSLPPGEPLRARFVRENEAAELAPVIDSLTELKLLDGSLLLVTHFAPAQPASGPVTVVLPQAGRLLSSTLEGSWIGPREGDRLALRLPAGFARPFSLRVEMALDPAQQVLEFALPAIERNTGREGELFIEERPDRRITLSAHGLQRGLPAASLPQGLREIVGSSRYARIPRHEPLRLEVQRFTALDTPQVVLEEVRFFTQFAESGQALTVMSLGVPRALGARLVVSQVPGAEVWSLKVNGRPREVYVTPDQNWVIPLDGAENSEVELAYLHKGERLALEGRLESRLPRTGLTARRVWLGISLPERVELLSLEGDLDPAGDAELKAAEQKRAHGGSADRAHWFSRAFYRGEPLLATVYYKEPAADRGGK